MVDEKIVQLVRKLHKNTQSRTITWAPTPKNDAFEATFSRYSVRIEQSPGRQGMDYVITIIDDQGVAVDDFSDVALSESFSDSAPEQGWFKFMGEIYEIARRQALGADQAIDTILEELQ